MGLCRVGPCSQLESTRNICKNMLANLSYSNLLRLYLKLHLRHPIPNLGAHIPNLGAPNQNLGAPTPNFGDSFKMTDTGSWRQSLG